MQSDDSCGKRHYMFLTTFVVFKSLQCANNDVIVGWCESGSIFIADARQL
jgi:hypothetical protein